MPEPAMQVGLSVRHTNFPGGGWGPIAHMVRLMAELFEADLAETPAPRHPALTRLVHRLRPRPRHGPSGAIFVARHPDDVSRFLAAPRFRRPAAFRCLWIIDSFWTERLTRPATLRDFDLVVYTQDYDRAFYEATLGARALCLPWGSDVLGLGSGTGARDIDVLRLGRQPDAWEDDALSAEAAATRKLVFHGRPPSAPPGTEVQPWLMRQWYPRARFVLAHTNRADTSGYTHDSKEYITARWTDALAAGAVVAGVAPESDVSVIDWPGALLRFEKADLEDNLDSLRAAVDAWRPEVARRNHHEALSRLDWRHRFATLASRLDIRPAPLLSDLARLDAACKALHADTGQAS